MGRLNFRNEDLTGKPVQQQPKDSHSVEIKGQDRFCGHRFLLKTRLFGDKRCLYCGKWFHWKDTNCLVWMRMGNIDNSNADNVIEPLHCGSDHCQEFHHLCKVEQARRKQIAADGELWKLFQDLKNKGVVA